MKTAKLIEELIETIEVSNDRELVQDIEVALGEVREGKTRPLQDLIRGLGLEEERPILRMPSAPGQNR